MLEPREFTPGGARWWQWPTILSLDAPIVTLAWQAMLTRVALGVGAESHHAILLGLGVWLAYAADRWIEGWRLTAATVSTQRHYFYLRWRWPVFVVWLLVLIGGIALAAVRLGAREWGFSLGLLAPALAYLLSHQFFHRAHPWRAPKELCVAAILTLGAAIYPLALSGSLAQAAQLVAPAGLFFLLALANCLLISDWEREVDLRHGQTSLALSFDSAQTLARRLPWGVAGLALAQAATRAGFARDAALCAAASAILLGWLARAAPRLGRERSRVLADLALLTPLVAPLLASAWS